MWWTAFAPGCYQRRIDEVEEARMNQRLATGQQQRRNLIAGEVLHHVLYLFPGQLAGVLHRHRVGVAVHATQVAGPRDVPDDDGPPGARAVWRGMAVAVAEIVGGLGLAGPEAGEVDHGFRAG